MEESKIETESETVGWKATGTAVKQRGRRGQSGREKHEEAEYDIVGR